MSRVKKFHIKVAANKAFQTDEVAVAHLLQKAQKLRHGNFASEQRRYGASKRARSIHSKRIKNRISVFTMLARTNSKLADVCPHL